MPDAPILLDVSRLIWRRWTRRLPTGIDRVCLAYLEHFAPRARAVVQFRQFRRILGREDSNRLFKLLLGGSSQFRMRLLTVLARAAWRHEDGAAGQLYLNVGHTGLNSPHLGPWLSDRKLRPIFLIHDLIPITHPQYCRAGEGDRHRERMAKALASARGILVNSKATEHELARFAGEQGLPMPRSAVAWLGTDHPQPEPARPDARDRSYFIMVGTIEARKNHLLMLQAWNDLINRMGADAPDLVIVGQRGWKADAAIEILDNLGPLASRVHELGRCDDARMRQLIRGARAMLMPSFIEGFGLPVVEALEMGTPVIASDLAVFREIASDIPDYLDPADRSGWVDLIADFTVNGPSRQAQLNRLAGFAAPRWSGHFKRVELFLETV